MKRNNRRGGRSHTEKEKEKKKKKTLQYLPHELTIQILLRLPVKSLTRFKCVCKLWYSLISDPHFANSHFQLSATTPSRRILLFSDKAPRSIDIEASLNHVYYASTSPSFKFFSPLSEHDQFSMKIRSSCRGFIFLRFPSSLCLWNPSTGIYKQIPFSTFDSKSILDSNIFCYMNGFGYDQSKDDYLVVSMSYDTSLDDTISSHLEFFSLRDNTWKEIEGPHFPYMTVSGAPKVGTLIGGAIHWFAFRRDLDLIVIVAFDLMERELVEMSLPDEIDLGLTDCDLWAFGDFLALWFREDNDDSVEIWVMTEYKVRSSWTKVVVLSIDASFTGFFYPICCTESGDIIGTDGDSDLWKYDDEGQLIEHCSYDKRGGCQLAMYTESLLSLPGDNERA